MTAPTLEKMREAAPHYGMGPHPWKDEDRDVLRWRARYRLWLKRHVTQRRTKGIGPTGGCSYCIRAATQRRLIVSPIEHWRRYEGLCNRRRCERRLLAWEQMGAARERRAVRDWELQHPDQVEYELTPRMPAQYPSVSRAALRAFLDSGEDAATVDGSSIAAISGSIRRLGFDSKVYAEQRSGQVVLRRVSRR
jgi:hypothetical protein